MRLWLLALVLTSLATACAATEPFPTSAKVPCTYATDREDAWLLDNCTLTAAIKVSRRDPIDDQAAHVGGNFVEVIAVHNDMVRVKVFTCARLPPWYSGNRKIATRD